MRGSDMRWQPIQDWNQMHLPTFLQDVFSSKHVDIGEDDDDWIREGTCSIL